MSTRSRTGPIGPFRFGSKDYTFTPFGSGRHRRFDAEGEDCSISLIPATWSGKRRWRAVLWTGAARVSGTDAATEQEALDVLETQARESLTGIGRAVGGGQMRRGDL